MEYRGVPKRLQASLTRKEVFELLVIVLLILIVMVFAMYLGWWSLQREEGERLHHELGLEAGELLTPGSHGAATAVFGLQCWPENVNPLFVRSPNPQVARG
jgi:hypothetical protein